MCCEFNIHSSFLHKQMNTIQAIQLGDKYILLDMLGIGGMAEVYRAKQLGQKGFEKQIVIKRLLPDVARDSEMVELFIGEARLAAMLQHDNIAATYDFGEIDGCYFLAMEYLSGVDLFSLLKQIRELERPLDPKYALMIAAKICEGMDYAHRLKDFQNKPLNLIHRDLTPHNIFITYDGKVKVIDFGVAKAEILDNKTQAGTVKGKLSYMSPEQLSGEKIDSRSDIFSIGILLYEMLSGRRMYTGDTAALIQKCLSVEYVKLGEFIPDLPSELYAILDKALERNRDERYQSCAQMQSDIEDLMFNMAIRPDAKNLQNYVRELFAEQYKVGQKKASLAMKSSTQAAPLSQQDKTVAMQLGPDEETVAIVKGTAEQRHPKGGAGAGMSIGRPFLIGGAALALVVVAAISLQAVFRDDNTLPAQFPSTAGEAVSASPAAKARSEKSTIIAELHEKAELSLAANRLVEPSDDCALKYLKEILNLDPGNAKALSDMARIGDYLVSQSEMEYKESNLEKARHYVDLGLQIQPDQQRLLQLQQELATLETADHFADLAEQAMSQNRIVESREYIKEGLEESPQYERLLTLQAQNRQIAEVVVDRLTEKVRQKLNENKLTTPPEDSALTYLKDIEKIDPENDFVERGYGEIADRYAALAEEAHRAFNIEKARVYAARGLEIVPDHRRLLALKADLSRSKPEVFIDGLGKNLKNMFGN